MNIVSEQFIFLMIGTFCLYYIMPKKFRYISLLIISIAFYGSLGISSLIYIGISTLTTFFAGIYMQKAQNKKSKKNILIATLVLNLGILVFMKSYIFMGDMFKNIIVPIGISYYTFQVVSYIIDVYKEKYLPQKNILKYFLYTMYFPYLSIGPINRYDDISKTLYLEDKKINLKETYYGVLRIAYGFFKKLVIANRISALIGTMTADVATYSGAYAFLAMILYSIEIYCDFSGGIDIVIGFSRTLGINLKENFNKPYLANSIKDFWRRWHIALSSWFKDYVYIPLGGNRCSSLRNSINIIIVFTLSGLWHGANYIIWGLAHGIIMCLEKLRTKKHKITDVIGTFLIVSVLWSFYIWDNNIVALQMIGSMFTNFNIIDVIQNITNLGLDVPNLIVLVISIIAICVFEFKDDKIQDKFDKKGIEIKILVLFIIILAVLIFGMYGIGFEKTEFIYNKF